jgi:ribosomal protein S8
MNTSDPIADMLTRIRNASLARHGELTLPSSRVKREIARILVEEGFIESFATQPGGVQELLTVQLKYVEGRTPVVSGRPPWKAFVTVMYPASCSVRTCAVMLPSVMLNVSRISVNESCGEAASSDMMARRPFS